MTLLSGDTVCYFRYLARAQERILHTVDRRRDVVSLSAIAEDPLYCTLSADISDDDRLVALARLTVSSPSNDEYWHIDEHPRSRF